MFSNKEGFAGSFTYEGIFRITKTILTFLLVAVFLPGISLAQWENNPSLNTQLVIETSNPIDISAISDQSGGSYIIWQDNRNNFQDEVYYMHVDQAGKISFRADGKRVSSLSGPEEAPVCSMGPDGSAAIIWKDYTLSNSGTLFAQLASSNGSLLWTDMGLQVTRTEDQISDYSVRSDNDGNIFISYIAKEPEITGAYKVIVQKITPDGKIMFDPDSSTVFNSLARKSTTSIIPDDEGGAFVFWLEYRNNKSVLLGQRVDSTGHDVWGKKPVAVSSSEHNVITYAVDKLKIPAIYAAWQTLQGDKDIFHEMIGFNGKSLWTSGGRPATDQKGSQVNPKILTSDSTVILAWTNETKTDKNIFIQKYNKKGKPLWNKPGVPVIKLRGEQFGQKMIDDNNNGAILAWIDRRADSLLGNIYAQRIDSTGKTQWDSLGVAVATNYNTPKSYLSLVSDGNGGAIAIFKNERNKQNNIYGQKIFNSGTYVSQILGFGTQLQGDSVKVSWYSANERGTISYNIQRAAQSDNDSISWSTIKTIYSSGRSEAVKYEYYDVPDTQGTLYYRVVQTDAHGNHQYSDISRFNYFGASSDVVLAQNNPNPFSDSTKISFYLPEAGTVTIEFFNSHVEKISEISKDFPEGENSITFNAEGLKPGIYFYRFRVNDFVSVKKMVLTN